MLYNFLETDQGKDGHRENEGMESIIETFVMYDLELVSGRLLPKEYCKPGQHSVDVSGNCVFKGRINQVKAGVLVH